DSDLVIGKVVDAFGMDLLENDKINRAKLSAVVFNNPEKLAQLNAIIHPQVKIHFMDWVKKHENFPIVIKETAILFETGSYKDCDKIILVTAPKEVRIQRVMHRDNVTKEAVEARMANQWEDGKKIQLSDFIIQNIHQEEAMKAADKIISTLKNQ
uniref:dephospho-CoA kinase n=1 Tax=uncultured Flavobacterium sp. TaxID=165435 RepID=UPI0025D0CC03